MSASTTAVHNCTYWTSDSRTYTHTHTHTHTHLQGKTGMGSYDSDSGILLDLKCGTALYLKCGTAEESRLMQNLLDRLKQSTPLSIPVALQRTSQGIAIDLDPVDVQIFDSKILGSGATGTVVQGKFKVGEGCGPGRQ